MSEREVRERDILVAPNEYAYVQDLTKGDIVLYVGPTKISLSNTERMIVLRDGRFVPVRGEEAGLGVHRFVEATSSQYVILENPPVDGGAAPVKGANSSVPLRVGRKIVVPGPTQFPLWPGQRAQVISGHELREDEYLVVRVYDDDGGEEPIGSETIIRGSDLSFYVPESGREVVPNENGRYERQAWRLDGNRGLHVRVTAPFEAEEGDQVPAGRYAAGEDLFVRGRVGYFFPTRSLEVVAAVDPVPLAEREAIYVRDRASGRITTVTGPVNYLVDPINQELVRRPLTEPKKKLYQVLPSVSDRAPTIMVAPSTAVMVIARDRREVVIGPTTRVLNFDEDLEVLTLSTGRPKRDDELLSTCFLQIQGNKVSDRITVKTVDHVSLDVTLSYRVSFVGDSQRWFNVKDYVGLLCDHLGSITRAAVRAVPIESFHERSTEVMRSAILGARNDDGEREGRHFAENGMWVYDVEVLDVEILDGDVDSMLCEAQRVAIVSDITRKQDELRLGDERLRERVEQEIQGAHMRTLAVATELEAHSRALELAKAGSRVEVDRVARLGRAAVEAEALERVERTRLSLANEEAELEAKKLSARADAFRSQMQAIAPELIATLKSVANKQLAAELSRNLSPLAILGGESVADVAGRLLERLPLGPSSGPGIIDIRGLLAGEGADTSEV